MDQLPVSGQSYIDWKLLEAAEHGENHFHENKVPVDFNQGYNAIEVGKKQSSLFSMFSQH